MATGKKTPELRLVRAQFKNDLISDEQLNDQQKQIINHQGSPLLVLGGAATGKSVTLIKAISNRIKKGEDPNFILVITYGRHTAGNMRDQIASANAKHHTVSEPIARTFHSLAFLIINDPLANKDEQSKNYVLLSGAEQDAQIRELLALDAKDPTATTWPAELIPALTTRGFAKELREFIGRATERGSSPQELIKYAHKYDQKYWPVICDFWQRYRQTLALRDSATSSTLDRIDPSEIVVLACEKLESNAALLEKYQKLFKVIYVDEFQESDRAQRKLLKLISGSELVIFADPASAVGRFRGADPDNLLSDLEEFEIKNKITLQIIYRTPKEPVIALLSSLSDEANFIAQQFRTAHLLDGVPYSQMAVVLRSPGAAVAALGRAFANNSIPVEIDTSVLSLSENPAIRPIITIAQIALGELKLIPSNWEQIEELLKSEFAGADAISIRQMRIAFTKEQKTLTPKSSTELILETLSTPLPDLPWEQLTSLKRINDLIKEAKKVLSKSSDIADLLWSIYSNAKNYEGELLSNSWRNTALNGGHRGLIADANLDAVITLFEVARRFSERMPAAKPILFIDQLMGENILADSITASAKRDEVVQVMTVHSAKGLQWRYVALAGMQEGNWPNLKQRGSLLGSERLVEIFRHGISNPEQLAAISAAGLAQDEQRLLNVATTRAVEKLIITAVNQEDNQPSSYFDRYAGLQTEITELSRPITAPVLVATLRSQIEKTTEDSEIDFAVRALKTLQENGISQADPKNWVGGLGISTKLPVITNSDTLRISPSSLESFSECALKWLLEQSGGRDADSTAQVLGTAIHVIAAQLKQEPDLSLANLEAKLKGAWSLIDINKGWIRDYEYRRAATMLEKFYSWNLKNKNTLIGVEERFEFKLGSAIVSGSIDRIELTADNQYFIVDLKTGATAISKEKALENKQLQSYQLAIINDGFKNKLEHQEVAGAQLIFVGDHQAKEAKVRPQEKIDSKAVTDELIQIATGMSDKTFFATINDRCRSCAVKSSCPIQVQGRSVI